MVIDKVHGLQATCISLNDRFTILATTEVDTIPKRQNRRTPINNFVNLNFKNQALIEEIARKQQQQARRRSLRQRLGVGQGGLRRFGSESRLVGLQRLNSLGTINQGRSVRARIGWKQSNGLLSRSASFSNLSRGSGSWNGRPLRGFQKRDGGQRAPKFRFRGAMLGASAMNGVYQHLRLAPITGGAQPMRGQMVRGRGKSTRGQGRGGAVRSQLPRTMFTKEELDDQLERYMAGTKAALDKDLDTYMRSAPGM